MFLFLLFLLLEQLFIELVSSFTTPGLGGKTEQGRLKAWWHAHMVVCACKGVGKKQYVTFAGLRFNFVSSGVFDTTWSHR